MCACAFQKRKVLRACVHARFKKGRYCVHVVFQKRKVLRACVCACMCVQKKEGVNCVHLCERAGVIKRKVFMHVCVLRV